MGKKDDPLSFPSCLMIHRRPRLYQRRQQEVNSNKAADQSYALATGLIVMAILLHPFCLVVGVVRHACLRLSCLIHPLYHQRHRKQGTQDACRLHPHPHHRHQDSHDYGYHYYQLDAPNSSTCDTSSSSPDRHEAPSSPSHPRHKVDGGVDVSRHRERGERRHPLPHPYDLRHTALHSPVDLLVFLLLVMTSASLVSSGRLVVWSVVAASVVEAAAASPAETTSSAAAFAPPLLTSRSTGLDSPLFSSGYPFIGERRLSSRTVTTKYGSLRGVTLTLTNRGLQPIEVFLGKAAVASSECKPIPHLT